MQTDAKTRFLERLSTLPTGYSTCHYLGKRWAMMVERLADGRQIKLYAEELGGSDYVSFNLYLPRSGKVLLKPCEMSEAKVVAFVKAVEPIFET